MQGASPTTIRVRAWKASTAEPATWGIVAADSMAALQTAGLLGIRTINDSSAAIKLELDDLFATALP